MNKVLLHENNQQKSISSSRNCTTTYNTIYNTTYYYTDWNVNGRYVDSQYDGSSTSYYTVTYTNCTDSIYYSGGGGVNYDGIVNTYNNPSNEEKLEATFQNLLIKNSSYNSLNQLFENAPNYLWPVVREIGIEMLIELFKKEHPYVKFSEDILVSLRAISQGDLQHFISEAFEILLENNSIASLISTVNSFASYSSKAVNIIKTFQTIYLFLGETNGEKLWKVINKNNYNVFKDFNVNGGLKGLRLQKKDIDVFWFDLVQEFNLQIETEYNNNGSITKIGSKDNKLFFTYYYSRDGIWSISINGNKLKFRF
ncbi:hypothetical protein [Membranihabitans marinus]|uniref:hypothetical protein n=1 Tax=Membranihabitans marinus TaxID=1227546 RepID=UPI001F22986E|nr:hypothetical protein [Membranihabitans marinus]